MGSCNGNCSSCSSDCGDRKAESLLAKLNEKSNVKKVIAVVSAVAPDGVYNPDTQGFTVSLCVTVILKIAMPVEILVPSYGYCAIPPLQEYSQEVCAGFFELPLYPQGGKNCNVCK